MPKYRVYVRGELDWDYEIEADSQAEAESEAEDKFYGEFRGVSWSAIETWDAEEIEE